MAAGDGGYSTLWDLASPAAGMPLCGLGGTADSIEGLQHRGGWLKPVERDWVSDLSSIIDQGWQGQIQGRHKSDWREDARRVSRGTQWRSAARSP